MTSERSLLSSLAIRLGTEAGMAERAERDDPLLEERRQLVGQARPAAFARTQVSSPCRSTLRLQT